LQKSQIDTLRKESMENDRRLKSELENSKRDFEHRVIVCAHNSGRIRVFQVATLNTEHDSQQEHMNNEVYPVWIHIMSHH
jgi:hypothetical protein